MQGEVSEGEGIPCDSGTTWVGLGSTTVFELGSMEEASLRDCFRAASEVPCLWFLFSLRMRLALFMIRGIEDLNRLGLVKRDRV